MDRINSGSRRDLSAVHMLSQTVYIYSILPTPNINLEGLKKETEVEKNTNLFHISALQTRQSRHSYTR